MDMKASDNVFTDDEQVENVTPVPVFNDNMEVVRNASKGVSSTLGVTAKALRLRVSLLKDLSQMGLIHVQHIRSEHNPSDIFTKVLGKFKIRALNEMCGIEK